MSEQVTVAVGMCEVCRDKAHKYKCPCCLLKTCSLACVKQHKADSECNGERNKTAYTSVKNFTDMTLLSDYRFLEDAGRKADESSRDRILPLHSKRPKHVHKMVQQSKKRGVRLRIMPYPMLKRKKNSSYFNYKQQLIMWHTEWVFPQAEVKYTKRVAEDQCVWSCVEDYLRPESGDAVIRHTLRAYGSADKADIRVVMRQEGLPSNVVRYHEMPLDSTLVECLKGKLVIEFPTLHVLLRHQWKDYTLTDDSITEEETMPAKPVADGSDKTIVTPKPIYPDSVKPTDKPAVTTEQQP